MCELLVSSASKDELLAALLDTVTQRLHVNDDSPDAERLLRAKQALQNELLRRAIAERQLREQQSAASVDTESSQSETSKPRDNSAAVRAAAHAAFVAEQQGARRAAAALKAGASSLVAAARQRRPATESSPAHSSTARHSPLGATSCRAPAVSAPPAVAVAAQHGAPPSPPERPRRATEPAEPVTAMDGASHPDDVTPAAVEREELVTSIDGSEDASADDNCGDGADIALAETHTCDVAAQHVEAWQSAQSARLSQPGSGTVADAPLEPAGHKDVAQLAETPHALPAEIDSDGADCVPSPPRSAPAGAQRPRHDAARALASRPARATTGTADIQRPRVRMPSLPRTGVDYSQLYGSFEHIFTGFAPAPHHIGRAPRADPAAVCDVYRSVAELLESWCADHDAATSSRFYRCPCSTHEEVTSVVARALSRDVAKNWQLVLDAEEKKNNWPGSWNLLWTWSSSQRPPTRLVPSMLVWQRWNHFAGIKALTRKDLLCRHLGAARSAYGAAFDIMPQTFSLPGDYVAFVDAFTRAAADSNSSQPLWIMKPIGSSRGRGIFMVRSLEDVAYGEPHVVQRYLERPLTVDGHKFDLRLFVLVTSFAPTEAFIYADGFARFSTERYTTADIANLRVHLTNYAVQNASGTVPAPLRGLHSGAAGGSKCSLTHLWSMLAAGRAGKGAFDAALLWPRICDLVRRALFCVRGAIGHQPNAFELLGFDVMLDDEARPWLLEVNSSPSMECAHPIDERLKTQLLADVMAIVAPPAFDRAALAAVLRQRSAGGGLRNSTRDSLNADLNAILGGQLPRCFGDMPQQLGLFHRIAPSVEWDALMKRTKKAV